MKMGKIVKLIILITIILTYFTSCENPIINKWWGGEDESTEPEYVSLIKYVPQIIYEIITEEKIVQEYVFIQLPPEIITEYITEYVYVEVKLPPEIVYEIVTKIEYVYIYEKIIEYIKSPPDKDTIIEWIKDPNNSGELKEIIIEIIKVIDRDVLKEIIKEIIKEIPGEEIIKWLTDEQIKWIIKQQPPEIIMQSIQIVDIEYIMFAGESVIYNGPPGNGGSTSLSNTEKNFNNSNIDLMAKILNNDPSCSIILHGHANPLSANPSNEDIEELKRISITRANSVAFNLNEVYKKYSGGKEIITDFEYELDDTGNGTNVIKSITSDRVSATGYGGEKNLINSGSTPYAGLNRRVEMILFKTNIVK